MDLMAPRGLRVQSHLVLQVHGVDSLCYALALETTVTVDRDHLTLRAHEMLYARGLRIPSRRSVERLVRRAISDVEAIDIKTVHGVISPEETQNWYERLVNIEMDGMSILEWIRRPPRQRGVKTRTLALQKLEYLRSNFPSLARSSFPVPPERLRAYARRLHRRRLDHAKELAEPG